jgi:peptide/nickel transport system substrate-binding protein
VHRGSTHRSKARRLRLFAVLAALALVLVACGGTSDSSSSGSSGGSSGSSSTTLKTAFVADMQVPDPDIFYETEGNQVVMSAYEGLVRYKQDPPSNELEGLLATSWTKSADGLTYTFKIRPNVKFFDGTPLNSDALKTSFERRTAVDQGPAYMLAEVASYGTPDPLTFVVNLKRPVSAFLDYLAAPYSPKAISPTAYAAHKGDDLGQKYLSTHSIGTGPYQISDFILGQKYVMEANKNYWGDAPKIKTLEMDIIPDLSTQQLQLEGGDLTILHNMPATTTNSFKGKSGFKVVTIPSLQLQVLKVNPNKPPFNDKSLRVALRSAIDKKKLTQDVFGDLGIVSHQMTPLGQLPDFPAGTGTDDWTYDPQPLKDAVAKLPSGSKSITITYAIGQVNDQRTAEAIQQTLSNAGLNVKVTPETIAQFFALRDQPESDVPNLLVETANPDAAQQDTYQRIFYNTGGFLNYLKGGDPAADTEMDNGLYTNDPSTIATSYGKAADLLHDSATFITIADVKGTFLATDKLSGWTSTAAAPVSLNFQNATIK